MRIDGDSVPVIGDAFLDREQSDIAFIEMSVFVATVAPHFRACISHSLEHRFILGSIDLIPFVYCGVAFLFYGDEGGTVYGDELIHSVRNSCGI